MDGMIPGKGQPSEKNQRLFGSSGIRGVVGHDLTEECCFEIAQAIGTLLPEHATVCVATDTRVSREVISEAVIAGLRTTGIDVTTLGILPTPALAFVTRDMGFDTGIMITASHNPPQFNGIKLFNENCIGYSRAQERAIERIYYQRRFRGSGLGSLAHSSEAKDRYYRFMHDRFSNGNLKHNFRITTDAGNGAAAGFASELFSWLGLDVFAVNDVPDGTFPQRDPEPREDTLEGTAGFVRQHNTDLAVCFDGDADRVVFLDREGFLGFNELIAFISRLAIERSGRKKVATTVETGSLLDLALNDLGADVVRGRVGDVHVAHLTKQLDAAIGVELVGVYLMPEIGLYPDSMFATLTLLSRINRVEQIRDFFKDIPRPCFAQSKVLCPDNAKTAVMEEVKINAPKLGACQVNTLDGLRFEVDHSWMLIRASGTEPLIRVSAEASSKAATDELLGQGIQLVERIVTEQSL
jgi:phosphoglucosamine mutase